MRAMRARRRPSPRLALLSSADATAEWRAACSSAQRMVVLGEHNGAAEVHVLVRGLCEETSPELARRVSDAHALLEGTSLHDADGCAGGGGAERQSHRQTSGWTHITEEDMCGGRGRLLPREEHGDLGVV